MSSARLPGKILRTAQGKPLFGYLLERLMHIQTPVPVVVATSREADDDVVASYCRDRDLNACAVPSTMWLPVVGDLGELRDGDANLIADINDPQASSTPPDPATDALLTLSAVWVLFTRTAVAWP